MANLQADEQTERAVVHARELRCRVDVQTLRAAVYRCHQAVAAILLPDQQIAALQAAQQIQTHINEDSDSSGTLACDSDARAFVRYWGGPPSDRLNGTQQLALSCYRDGRYAGARQVSEVMALDNGMAWSLIGHLRATPEPEHAHRQIQRTFDRAMRMAESARDALNAQISGPDSSSEDMPALDPDDLGPAP
jgi:hypothetical protein